MIQLTTDRSREAAHRFYERLGFVAEGPVYDDAGIPHRDMVLTDAEKATNDRMMVCCSGAKSTRLVLDL